MKPYTRRDDPEMYRLIDEVNEFLPFKIVELHVGDKFATIYPTFEKCNEQMRGTWFNQRAGFGILNYYKYLLKEGVIAKCDGIPIYETYKKYAGQVCLDENLNVIAVEHHNQEFLCRPGWFKKARKKELKDVRLIEKEKVKEIGYGIYTHGLDGITEDHAVDLLYKDYYETNFCYAEVILVPPKIEGFPWHCVDKYAKDFYRNEFEFSDEPSKEYPIHAKVVERKSIYKDGALYDYDFTYTGRWVYVKKNYKNERLKMRCDNRISMCSVYNYDHRDYLILA